MHEAKETMNRAGLKAIAFYLPQFHPIPENDEWWGEGFTEWTNVKKAESLFDGHWQPRIPADLGYYDLRDPQMRREQARLAKAYGLHGFCYYYYWFNGKKLLDLPLQKVLESGEPDFPFCLCYANENWTRAWDGLEQDILIKQEHSPENDLRFIHDIIPILQDPRYIRVNNKPLLLIYRAHLFPDPRKTTELWRAAVKSAGLGDLYLCKCEVFGDYVPPEELGFDANVEFPPHGVREIPTLYEYEERIRTSRPLVSACIYDYETVAHVMMSRQWPDYRLFRAVMLGWDNTARRREEPTIFHHFSPEVYEEWLAFVSKLSVQQYPREERIVFINAWNEWSEGTYLEPDQKYGLRCLEATKRAIESAEVLRYREARIGDLETHSRNLEEVAQHRDTRSGDLETHSRKLAEVLRYREARILDLKTHSRNLEEVVQHRDARIGDLETHSRKLAEVLRYREARIGDLETHSRNLEEVVQHRDARIGDLETHSRNLEEVVQHRDARIGDLETHSRNLEEVVRHKDAHIGNLEQAMQHKDAYIGNLEEAMRHKDAQIGDLVEAMRHKDETLYSIYSSHGWKLLLCYYKIRDRLLPANSRRRKTIKFLWNLPKRNNSGNVGVSTDSNFKRALFYLKSYGLKSFLQKVRKTPETERADYLSRPTVPVLRLLPMSDDNIIPLNNASVSVIIPAKNAGEEFEHLLAVLREQKGFKGVEIVVVDSGSSDKTVETARLYGAKVIQILPENFSHSYARNLGADNASGDYLFFTVQDALLPSHSFLFKLYTALRNHGLSAVSCSEFPREDSDLFYNVMIWNHYRFLGVDQGDRILEMPEKEDYISLRQNGQLSDIACLIPKEVFQKYKYRNDYAEDLDFGIRLIRDGGRMALLSSVKIIHSHKRPPLYFLKRGYVDNVFLSKVFPDYPMPSLDERNLFRDIILTYFAACTVVKDIAGEIILPVGAVELFGDIERRLRSFDCPGFASALCLLDSGSSSHGLETFLKKVANLCAVQEADGYPFDSVLVPAVLHTLNIVKEYMSISYPVIDDGLWEDLKACILKAYALQCGAHLASCYLKESPLVRELHDELKGGI